MTTRNELVTEVSSMVARGWTAKTALHRLLDTNETYRAYWEGLTSYARSLLLQYLERTCKPSEASK